MAGLCLRRRERSRWPPRRCERGRALQVRVKFCRRRLIALAAAWAAASFAAAAAAAATAAAAAAAIAFIPGRSQILHKRQSPLTQLDVGVMPGRG